MADCCRSIIAMTLIAWFFLMLLSRTLLSFSWEAIRPTVPHGQLKMNRQEVGVRVVL